MCWYHYGFNIESIIAEKDIEVYKVVRKGKNESLLPYYHYNEECVYTLNKISDLVPIEPYYHEYKQVFNIDEGYHSYKIEASIKIETYETGFITIYDGDTFLGTFDYSEENGQTCLVKGIIPKGTKYYINDKNECVSERIKITKIIK